LFIVASRKTGFLNIGGGETVTFAEVFNLKKICKMSSTYVWTTLFTETF